MSKRLMWDGSCDGSCYECECQRCEGSCALRCGVTSYPEENAVVNDVEEKGHVIDCTEYVPHLEQED